MIHRVIRLGFNWSMAYIACINAAATARAAEISVPVDFPNVQAAIEAANNGDTIILANGIYTGLGNFDIDFLGKAITVRSVSGPEACIIDCLDSGRGFIFQSNETGATQLQGVTITHAFFAGPGGAIFVGSNSGPTIVNCILAENRTDSIQGGPGAGVYNSGSNTSLIDCIIRDNTANEATGGGIANFGTLSMLRCTITGNKAITDGTGGGLWNGGTVVARHCDFADNSGESGYAEGRGGAVFNQGTARLIDCTFEHNLVFQETPLGGAIFNSANGVLTLRRCTFTENGSDDSGDPIWGGAIYTRGTTTITDTDFHENLADTGGAIFIESGDVLISKCRFERNSAREGGAIAFLAGNLTIVNGVFFGNRASMFGGGAISSGGQLDLTNGLFVGNQAVDEYVGGAAMRLGGTSTITNCTIVANSADSDGGGIILDPNASTVISNSILWANRDSGPVDQSAQIFNNGGSIDINRSCVRGLDGSLGGAGNIAANPKFVNANGPDGVAGNGDDDLRLTKLSPCINGGSKSSLPADVADLDNDNNTTERLPLDLLLHKRTFGPRTDMGAFEFKP